MEARREPEKPGFAESGSLVVEQTQARLGLKPATTDGLLPEH